MKGLSKSEQRWFAIMRIITRCVIYDERMKGKYDTDFLSFHDSQ